MEAPKGAMKPLEVQFFTGSRVRQYPGVVLHDGPRLLGSLKLMYGAALAPMTARIDCLAPLPPGTLLGCEQRPALRARLLSSKERNAYWRTRVKLVLSP